MVLRPNNNSSKRSENENPTPASSATTASKALVTRLQSEFKNPTKRRRSPRTSPAAATTRTAKYAVEQAKRRRDDKDKVAKSNANAIKFTVTTVPSLSDIEMVDGSATVPPPKTFPISLPKELARPEFKEIDHEIIDGIDPALADTDLEYFREHLEVLGPELLQSLASIKVNAMKDKLPKELPVSVNDLTTILPTHLLAVFGKQPASATPGQPRKVTLFPVHSLVLAATCAHIPKPPGTLPVPAQEEPQTALPVWSMCLPSPITYPQLSTYLYLRNIDHLMRSMLPCPLPPAFFENQRQLLGYATHLSSTFTVQALVKHVFAVHGLWQNCCALGVFDNVLWEGIDLVWKTLLTALAIATGNPSVMIPAPAPASATQLAK